MKLMYKIENELNKMVEKIVTSKKQKAVICSCNDKPHLKFLSRSNSVFSTTGTVANFTRFLLLI